MFQHWGGPPRGIPGVSCAATLGTASSPLKARRGIARAGVPGWSLASLADGTLYLTRQGRGPCPRFSAYATDAPPPAWRRDLVPQRFRSHASGCTGGQSSKRSHGLSRAVTSPGASRPARSGRAGQALCSRPVGPPDCRGGGQAGHPGKPGICCHCPGSAVPEAAPTAADGTLLDGRPQPAQDD